MKLLFSAVSLILFSSAIGLAQTAAMPSPASGGADTADNRAPAAASAEGKTGGASPASNAKGAYVLGPNDEVAIRVWGNQNLTGIYNVGPDGLLSMPLIGATKADGMTLEQLTGVISRKLGEQIVAPEVNIEIVRVNSKKYFIMGEGAARPGEFPLTGPTTVSEAIAISGGMREFANSKKIYLLRGVKKFPFNYKDVIQGKHLEQDIQVENGDRIVIPQ